MAPDTKAKIQAFFRGEMSDDDASLEKASRDASIFKVRPALVVRPKDADDVKALVRFANKESKNGNPVSLAARGAGTDMTGGPLTESIVVDCTAHLNGFLGLTDMRAVAQPGMMYRDFEKETLKQGLVMPSYPASRELCTVGGMVADNAGGEKTLSYGKTDRYVAELKMVLSDGNEYSFKPLSMAELEEKKKLETLEGRVYRDMHTLVSANHDVISRARIPVSKNSSGYALWDVLDTEKGIFDLTKLFVGAQGTLGLNTEATFSLVRLKKHSRLLVINLKDMGLLDTLVPEVLKENPESFESYDAHTINVSLKLFPQIMRRLGGNVIKLVYLFLPEIWAALTGRMPKLVLLAEFTGDTAEEAEGKAKRAAASIAHYGLPTKITAEDESKKFWVVRRESFNLLRQNNKSLKTVPFVDDIIVRPEKLPEFLPELYALLDKYPLIYTIAGHVGDGNFHIIPLMDMKNPKTVDIIMELSDKVFALIRRYDGSNTAEHGDGLIRSFHLKDVYGPKMFALFEQTKRIFDPDNIFNPGKKVGATREYALAHINRE